MKNKGPTDADYLAVDSEGGQYVLNYRNQPMLTWNGKEVRHPNKNFLIHMFSEYAEHDISIEEQRFVDPQYLSSYQLYCMQHDVAIPQISAFDKAMRKELEDEDLLYRGAAWRKDDSLTWEPLRNFCKAFSLELPSLEWERVDEAYDRRDAVPLAFSKRIEEIFNELHSSQRAAVIFLSTLHNGALIWPIILVLGWCSAKQYATAVFSVNGGFEGRFVEDDIAQEESEEVKMRLQEIYWLADEATIVSEYLVLANKLDSQSEAVLLDVAGGETATREFKETLRWNIRREKYDKDITHSSLKTICAFLNTDGGTLYIGVNDSGELVGLSRDGFENGDKFLLHLYNVMKQAMGDVAATMVDAKVIKVHEVQVCQVVCKQSPDLVVMAQKNGNEESFIRTGPSTVRLKISEVHKHMARRES